MIKKIFHSKNHRTLLAKKNIMYSLLLKVIGMVTMFALVPLSIKYLGNTNYGIWITVSGIIAWAGMFDFGFSHGLRNRLTESLAKNDYETGRYLVSSTYFFMFIISVILTIIFYLILISIHWQSLLNLPKEFDIKILYIILQIIFFFFIVQFFLKPINSILQAYQLPAIVQAIGTIGGIMIILGIILIKYYQIKPELIFYALVVAGTPIVVSLGATVYFFSQRFRLLLPSLSFIKLKYIKSIGGLGLSFFIIQLSLLVVYSSDNLIISYLFGPGEVTTYHVVYKYFSVITIFFGVVMSPFWSAITDAYTKNEMKWIQKTIRSLLFILLFGILISCILFYISPWIFQLWIGEEFTAPISLKALMAIYAISIAWLNIFSFFSNGIGKIRIQLIAYIFAALINIPMSYYFGKVLHMGSSGVLLATIICIIGISLVLSLQYMKIINNSAKGIWNK